jgi:AcrR family transcriptional regulator
MSRTGRRPGDASRTREDILEAARSLFASLGYDGATTRRIADEAGVDSALIAYHFGSKEQLFVAVHELPINPSDLALLIDGRDDEIGERVARFSMTMLAADDSTAVSLMRASASNPAAAEMLREFIERTMVDPIAEQTGMQDSRERVALVAAQILGVLFARHNVRVPELASASIDDLVDLIGPVLQRYMTEPVH